jgi:ferrous-iron efflux pump FieF
LRISPLKYLIRDDWPFFKENQLISLPEKQPDFSPCAFNDPANQMNYREMLRGKLKFPGDTEREQALFVSLLAGIIPVIPALAASILSGSVAFFALTLKTINEAVSTLIAWMIAKKISRGGQGNYDYGMGKYETIARVVTGGLMLVSLVFIVLATAYRFFRPAPLVSEGVFLSIVILVISVAADVWFWVINYRIAVKESSPLMDSQWRLFRTKAVGNMVVLVTMILAIIFAGYPWVMYIDPVGSVIIIASLLVSGYGMIRTSFPDLVDRTLDEELQIVVIRELADHFDRYKQLHGVRSRRSGTSIFIEVFLEFEGEMQMCVVQEEIDRMKKDIETKIPRSSVNIIPTSDTCANPNVR